MGTPDHRGCDHVQTSQTEVREQCYGGALTERSSHPTCGKTQWSGACCISSVSAPILVVQWWRWRESQVRSEECSRHRVKSGIVLAYHSLLQAVIVQNGLLCSRRPSFT